MPTLVDLLPPAGADPSTVLDVFAEWASVGGRPLYGHQEEAALALATGDHVVLATPTGSGKSLVAMAGIVLALQRRSARGVDRPDQGARRREVLRSGRPARRRAGRAGDRRRVDQPGAPVLVCTAEVLANHALVDGTRQRLRLRLPRRVPLLRRPRSRLGVAGAVARADELPDVAGLGDVGRHECDHHRPRASGPAGRSPR